MTSFQRPPVPGSAAAARLRREQPGRGAHGRGRGDRLLELRAAGTVSASFPSSPPPPSPSAKAFTPLLVDPALPFTRNDFADGLTGCVAALAPDTPATESAHAVRAPSSTSRPDRLPRRLVGGDAGTTDRPRRMGAPWGREHGAVTTTSCMGIWYREHKQGISALYRGHLGGPADVPLMSPCGAAER